MGCKTCGTVSTSCDRSDAISFTGGETGATGATGAAGADGADGIATLYNDLTQQTRTGSYDDLIKSAYSFTVADNFDSVGDKIKLIAVLDLSTDYSGNIYFSWGGSAIGVTYYKESGSGEEYVKMELVMNCKATASGDNVITDFAGDVVAVGAGGVSTRICDPYATESIDLSGSTSTFDVGVHSDQSAGTVNLYQFSIERMKKV